MIRSSWLNLPGDLVVAFPPPSQASISGKHWWHSCFPEYAEYKSCGPGMNSLAILSFTTQKKVVVSQRTAARCARKMGSGQNNESPYRTPPPPAHAKLKRGWSRALVIRWECANKCITSVNFGARWSAQCATK